MFNTNLARSARDFQGAQLDAILVLFTALVIGIILKFVTILVH